MAVSLSASSWTRSIARPTALDVVGASARLQRLALTACVVVCPASVSGQIINEDLKLLASDGAARDQFGHSVGVADGLICVGARLARENDATSGAAYVFDSSTGAQIAKLIPDDGASGDEFGISIAIADGIVVVGSWLDDDAGSFSGSAYLFDAITGTQLAKLVADDAAASDEFGVSVAIAGGVAAVGSWFDGDNGLFSGSAYLFDAGTGAQLAKLVPNDGAAFDRFGFSIAIADAIVAVGVPFDDDNGSDSGSAYLFDAGTGTQLAKLLPDDGAEGDEFGRSIAIADGNVVIGAKFDDDNGEDSGSVYIFDTANGQQLAKLLASDGLAGGVFGKSVAIADGIVAVGADDTLNNEPGSGYLFDAATGGELAKLLPSDAVPGQQFGHSIGIDKGQIAVGSRLDDENGEDAGAAYVFARLDACLADIDGDGDVDAQDFFGYLDLFASGDAGADIDGDSDVDAEDFFAYLDLFAVGCP